MQIDVILEDLSKQAFYFPRAILLAIPMILAWMFWKGNRGHIKEKMAGLKRKWWIFAFFVYAAFILVSAVMGRVKENPMGAVTSHILPGIDIRVWRMNIENTLIFIPYAFLFLQAFKPENSWKSSLTLVMVTTFFIEGCQLLFWLGKFQVSDMIYNLIGGIIGIAIWTMGKKICSLKKKSHIEKISTGDEMRSGER